MYINNNVHGKVGSHSHRPLWTSCLMLIADRLIAIVLIVYGRIQVNGICTESEMIRPGTKLNVNRWRYINVSQFVEWSMCAQFFSLLINMAIMCFTKRPLVFSWKLQGSTIRTCFEIKRFTDLWICYERLCYLTLEISSDCPFLYTILRTINLKIQNTIFQIL